MKRNQVHSPREQQSSSGLEKICGSSTTQNSKNQLQKNKWPHNQDPRPDHIKVTWPCRRVHVEVIRCLGIDVEAVPTSNNFYGFNSPFFPSWITRISVSLAWTAGILVASLDPFRTHFSYDCHAQYIRKGALSSVIHVSLHGSRTKFHILFW